jgi:flagellar hook-associated protein 1 FlgK
MANLLSILSGAQTSLAAQRAVTATASHNIDNANNAGYSRQTASLEALTPAEQVNGAFIGRGATLGTVTQARDRFLEAQIPQALGDAAFSTAQADALQAFHGLDPEAAGGLGPAISGFYSSLRALAQNPSDSGLRSSFLGAANALAQTFNRTSQTIESSRSGLDAQAGGLVGEINSEAAAVAQLNVQVQQARASGAEPNDLLDLRQGHLDKLAELAGATTVATSEGYVNVVLKGGVALVAGARAGELSVQPDDAPPRDGHLGLLLRQADGTGPVSLSNAAVGGSLGGTLFARDGLGGTLSASDGSLRAAGANVDQLAFDLANGVNATHQLGYGVGLYESTTGLDLLATGAPGVVAGAARNMAVLITDTDSLAMASAPGAPGDAGNAQLLVATESAPLSGGKDVQSTVSDVVSQFGSFSASAKAFADQDGAVKDQLSKMRDSYSGVSIDEEMITMQSAQRAYEAIAKVIQTTDQMMQTLLAIKT